MFKLNELKNLKVVNGAYIGGRAMETFSSPRSRVQRHPYYFQRKMDAIIAFLKRNLK